MTINFPSNPSTNDTYSYGDKSWIFNGIAWEINNSGNIGNIAVTGNITAGNILTDNYFFSNGDPFVSSNYGNVDVATYLTEYTGNLTAGNITVSGIIHGYATTSYVDTEVANLVNAAPSTLDTLNELATALGNDSAFSTTITSLIGNNTSNIATIQSQIANLNYYDDTNVTTFLSDIGSNNISTTGDITANSFIGDGSQLTGLPSSYTDANVADYLPTYTGNITAGNIISDYFIGNGSQISGVTSSAKINFGNTAPVSPTAGDFWIDSDTGKQFIYFNDGDSSQWIQLATTTSISVGDSYGNVDVATYLTEYTGNLTAGNILTDNYFYANGEPFVSSNYGDNDVLTYLGNISGNVIPSSNVTYNLGSPTNQWHSLYVGPGSLYVNNKKVIEDDSGRITVSTSVNQNLAIKTSGSGDIELFPEGSGVINLQGNVQADSGVIFSGTGGLKFGSNLNLDNNNINNLDDPVQSQDAATKSYVDTQIASAQGNYSDSNVASYLPTYTGNLTAGNITVSGTIDGYATTSYVDTELANLVASAPSTLDTLNELAAALGNDPNLSTTLTSLIGNNSANITTLQGNITSIETDISNLEANVPANLQSNVTTLEGNIVSIESDVSTLQGNIIALDNQVANLNYYDDTNVTTFLSDIGSNAITTTGDITANSFIGDGSQLTGLPASYSDSNVASYLPTYTGNITAGNILTDNYFYANGEAFVSGGGGNSLTLANSAPSSPNNGDIWVDSDTGREYTYINDGDSLQWVELATSFIDINSYNDSNVLAYLGNISGNLIPSANVTYDLGSETNRWNTIYLAGNTINLGGAQIKADPDTGTIALIPQIKSGETATKAIVIGQQGIATVDTDSNGTVSTEAIQEAATNPNTTTTNMFVNSNAYITGNITAGNILTDNYFYANGEPFVSGSGGTSAETAIFNFPTTINSNLTIESGNNGLSVGPISQANNTVISINAGQRWIIL